MALEPSQGMVEQAKKKGIYKQFIAKVMGAQETSIMKGETTNSVLIVKQVNDQTWSRNIFDSLIA